MLKRKLFKHLSKSQKNRRLKKMCNSLDNNENNPVLITYKNIKCGKTIGETINNSEFQDDKSSTSSSSLYGWLEDDKKSINHVLEESINYIDIKNNYYDFLNDSSIDEIQINRDNFFENKKSKNFNKVVARWVCGYGITHEATGALLKILKNVELDELRNLPLDPRILLGTPKSTIIRSVPPGEYFHYSLKNALLDQLKIIDIDRISTDIQININIDGLPIAKSSKSQLYPILGEMYPKIAEPFVIGAYHGNEKPNSCNTFLREFIDEYNVLHQSGFYYCNQIFTITIRAVICDSPARSFVTCTKNHNGYFGCGKCREEGNYNNHRMLFLNSNAALRTDENFIQRIDEDHHIGTSPFEETGLGMVSQFPLDYMHLICLGVVKKILQTFTHGSHKQKFSAKMIKEISANLKTIAKWIPSEFARKTRELENLDRWKATELRSFLLYVGPVALHNYLPKKYLIHFISLHCAIRILCHETDCKRNNKYAKDLLNYFVEKCIELFGTNFLIYNTHNLIHLADDVLKFGHLDSFSAFSFESYLYNIKKKLKKAEKPLQQLHNRIVEHVACNLKKKIIFFEKPKVMCKNNKKSEELGIASYNTIHYNKFTLSTINEADQFCYLQDNTIVRVKNICLNNDNPILIGESLINPIGFPNYPIDSKQFDIVIGNQWSHSTNFDANDVTRKAVCIPYKKSYCFLPSLHSYN